VEELSRVDGPNYTILDDCELKLKQEPPLGRLHIPHSIYRRIRFPISRPKALLAHQNLHVMIRTIQEIKAFPQCRKICSFRVAAAGESSSVFLRLREELARGTHLTDDPEEGELLLRVRRGRDIGSWWEVLIRTTPRPLSWRAWRINDRVGALNGSLAAALVASSPPQETDRVVDLTCGTGTLLVERLAGGPLQELIGIDADPTALETAEKHLERAGFQGRAKLINADLRKPLPLEPHSYNVILSNLPWGEGVGSRRQNRSLYKETCLRIEEVASSQARAVILTQDAHTLLFHIESLLPQWHIEQMQKVSQRGFHPTVFVLQREKRP
jgi:tRNA (guanine6-N2)-methyltransferase